MEKASLAARRQKYEDEVLRPLGSQGRFRELCDWIIEALRIEEDLEFRFYLIPDLCLHLHELGDGEACRKWAKRMTEEFNDRPFAWTNMSIYGTVADIPGPLDEMAKNQKLDYLKTALDRAHKKNQWVRYVLFDICLLLTSKEDYAQLTDHMKIVISDLENNRDIDIPFLEASWLKRIPDGAIDTETRQAYEALVAADLARRSDATAEEKVPTRKDLEKYL